MKFGTVTYMRKKYETSRNLVTWIIESDKKTSTYFFSPDHVKLKLVQTPCAAEDTLNLLILLPLSQALALQACTAIPSFIFKTKFLVSIHNNSFQCGDFIYV